MRKSLIVVVAIGMVGACSGVLAQTQGGAVRGGSNVNVNAENINTIAVGTNNVARTSIGSVKSGAKGNSNVTVDVKNVSNVVTGHGRKGCINIGVKGADPECK